MTLPLSKTYAPMEAQPAEDLPKGSEWHYEPKWDGFRCLAFRDGNRVDLESKSGKPLTRYFPELVEALRTFRAKQFVLDGEIVIPVDGDLSFDDLLMRIHPAATRVAKLSKESPSRFIVFDLLVDASGKKLVNLPLRDRRRLFAVPQAMMNVRTPQQAVERGRPIVVVLNLTLGNGRAGNHEVSFPQR